MARFGFPRQARLVRRRDFERAYRRGRRHRIGPLRFCALSRGEGGSRLGLSISRKVGKPVVRNRWKRAIREAFRLNRHLLRRPHDIVVSVEWEAGPEDVARVEASFRELIARLNAEGAPQEGGP